jgi:hypothetical protein
MAKVIAPFKITGTLDDINFVLMPDGKNYARMKGKTGVTSEQFKNNPVFDTIRNQGSEFGHCVKKSALFRQIAQDFNKLSKEVSFAGRVNKLLFEILEEDSTQPRGHRTLLEGLKTSEGKELLLGFESNKLRPLPKVLKIKEQWNRDNQTLKLIHFVPQKHLDWPEEATHVQLAIAMANWDFEKETFDTCYCEKIMLSKESEKQTVLLKTEIPKGDQLHLTFFFIGFAKQDRKKLKLLHRKNNTTTIIASEIPNAQKIAEL